MYIQNHYAYHVILHVYNIQIMIVIVFCVICFVFEMGSHCAALTGLELIDQAGPKLIYLSAFASPVLGLKVCTATTSISLHFMIKLLIRTLSLKTLIIRANSVCLAF